MLRWAWPALVLLAFVLPMPQRLETALSSPLRGLATAASAYIMQTVGLPAFAQNNTIVLDDATIGVVDACSGLGMIMTMIPLTLFVCFITKRPAWQKITIFVSALPIALADNVVRIALTGILQAMWGARAANFFHDQLAGWLMFPAAWLWCGWSYASWTTFSLRREGRPGRPRSWTRRSQATRSRKRSPS